MSETNTYVATVIYEDIGIEEYSARLAAGPLTTAGAETAMELTVETESFCAVEESINEIMAEAVPRPDDTYRLIAIVKIERTA